MKEIKKIISGMLASVISTASCVGAIAADGQTAANESKALLPYQNTSLSFEERAADLVSRMTLAEKAAQTGRSAPEIKRLGVSKYNYWREGIHGVARQGVATSFPSSLAMSNTWDRQLMYDVMSITSTEARGKNNKTDLSYWNPTINMARDPRWGRNEESYGEDTYLTTELGKQAVEGMQGNDDKYLKVISTLKHFAANNIEGERQRGTSIMTDKTLREYYTRAFKDIIESSDPASVMSSYNAETITRNGETIVDYIASSSNKYLLTDLLRRSWGFSGYVVGDCGAFDNLYSKPSLRKNLFPDMKYEDITPEMTISTAFNAGGDLDCGSAAQANVYGSVEQGHMSEDTLDVALYRLFLARMRTGEFDGDNIVYRDITKDVIEADEHVAKAEQAAEESWVLLENKNDTLPIKSNVTKVAVVGSFADKLVLGDYSGEPTKNTTPIEGITSELKKLNPDVEVQYLGNITDDTKLFNVKSINLVLKNGTKRAVDLTKAENVTGMTLSNGILADVTPTASAVIKNVNFKDVATVEIEMSTGSRIGGALSIAYGAGGPSVATVNTTATADNDTYAVCSGAYTGEDGGYNETADMYISVSAKKEDFTVEAYKTQLDAADYIIAYAATVPKQNGLGTQDASESNDRKTIDLPEHEGHVQAIADAGDYADKTIVAMSTVGQMNVAPFKDKCAAILWTSYNGQTQGEALGKILTGAANPSGRLSTTWYAPSDLEKMPLGTERIKDNSIGAEYYYTSYEIAQGENYPGRTYQYYSGNAVYPFGYGKSYTDFAFSNIRADKTSVDANGTVTISVDVENTGSVAGTAVPQLYITVPGADGKNLPLKQLKGFERTELATGEKKTVNFTLNIADVNFYDEQTMKNYVVNGEYTAKVSANADDAGVSVKFNVTGALSDELKNVTVVPTGVRLIGIKEGEKVVGVNSIDASASAALENDYVISDLSSVNDATVTYTSSNTSVASVSDGGFVTVGASEGTATITVSVTRNGVTKTDSFPVVTQLKDKITDARKAEILAELEKAYTSCYEPSYSEENYKKLTAVYEKYKAQIEESIVADESEAFLASALKEMAAIPVNEMKVKNAKDGKITVTVPYDSAVLIEAKYSGNRLTSVKTNQITEKGDIILEGYEEDDEVTLMLWDGVSKMKPLLPVINHKYNAPVQLNEILFDFSDSAFDSFYETADGQKLTSDTGMDGYGQWQTENKKKSIVYNDKTYNFTRGLKQGQGSETQRCVYFTPESDGMVTVFFNASTDRKVIVKQNGQQQEKFGDGNDLTAFEVNVTANSPVYIFGGGSNKVIYGVLFRTAGIIPPPTPKPTEEPMPEIVSRDKMECESYVKAWTNRMTTSDVSAASGGKLIDNTKNGDIIYMGTRNISNLAGIELVAGTKEASAAVEFFAVDMTGREVTSMSQSDVNALLTTANSIGKTSLKSSDGWNNLYPVTARVKTDKSGMMGIFMKCSTSASYCGNFDYIELMYAAGEQAAAYSVLENGILDWNGAKVALEDNRIIQIVGESVTVDITPESFAQSDLADGDDVILNCIIAVDDQLYAGCDGGYLITMTPCSKCSIISKACDFDIKSLEYDENVLTLIGEEETAVMNIADIRGYSISGEAAALMAKKGAILIDVRSAEEFAEKSFEGSVNIPIDDIEKINELPKDKTLIFYCSSGVRAEKALQYAKDMGFEKIYNLRN